MKKRIKIWFRKTHRWLGLLMVLQICAWMLSGFYFAWYPIETIRGEHFEAETPPWAEEDLKDLVSSSDAWSALQQSVPNALVHEVKLIRRGGQTWYRFLLESEQGTIGRLVNARSGEPARMLDADEALQAARDGLSVEASEVSLAKLEHHEAGSEFRGRALPLWRVTFQSPEKLNIYVDAWTGEVVARRTDKWRLFDFLWMLHIMDFDERDDFNTPLLQGAALLGLILALTGLIYWALTTRSAKLGAKNLSWIDS